MMVYRAKDVLEILERRCSEKGCHSDMFVHPEAALMGLLNHYNHYSEQADQDVDTQRTQQIVQPVRSFYPSCLPKLTFRGGGGSWRGCDCCYPEVLLVLSLARQKFRIAIRSSCNAWHDVSMGPPESRCQRIGAEETGG